MAITKLVSPSTPNPTGTGAGASWDLAMAQLTAVKKILSGEQMLLTQWTNTTTMPKLALGIYLQHLGAIYVVDSADYTIPTPSSDGTWYAKLTVSGETLTVSVVNSLSGFAWSSQHNGLYNASNEQILPYQIVRGSAGTTFEKRKILNLANATNAFTTINYLGKVYGMSVGDTLEVTGNATVGGDISASNFESKSVSGVSLDSLVKSGFYRVSSSTGLPPSASDSGTLFVTQGGDTITQIYGDYSTGFTYYRTGNPPEVGGQGSWNSWRSNNIIAGLSYAVGASHQYLPAIEIGDSISFTCSQAQANIFLYTPAGGSYVLWIKQAYTISTGTTYSYSWTLIAGSTPVPMTPQGNYNYTMYLTRVS